MAINPEEITTVQVNDLPPASFSDSSILAHAVGDILSRGTVSELVSYIQTKLLARPYEIKYLVVENSYINDNFDMTIGATQGVGKAGGLWETWAICNGNNGTNNLDGQTLIGFGANYPTIGYFTGSKEVTLTINQIPAHSHDVTLYNASPAPGNTINSLELGDPNNPGTYTTNSKGGGLPHNNMQPSMVVLMIMKLP